jgi:hypothetical protein
MITPFRFHPVANRVLITNEIGDYGLFEEGVIDRILRGNVADEENEKLRDMSVLIEEGDEWRLGSLMRRLREKHRGSGDRLS